MNEDEIMKTHCNGCFNGKIIVERDRYHKRTGEYHILCFGDIRGKKITEVVDKCPIGKHAKICDPIKP